MTSKRTGKDIESTGGLWATVETEIKSIGAAMGRLRKRIAAQDFEGAAEVASAVRTSLDNLTRLREEVGLAESEFRMQAERQFSEFEDRLRIAISQRGWKLDGTWPSLYVERGIPIDIDERNRTVKVGGRQTPAATVDDVLTALEPIVAALLPKNFAPKTFIDRMAKAYENVKGNKTQVPALDVYRGLVLGQQTAQFWRDARGDRFEELSLDQFRARLSRCLEARCIVTTDGRELRMLPPLDPKDGIFLYQPAELRFSFLGRIEFVKV